MPAPPSILSLAADLAAHHRPFILITVTSAKGSTPRNAGAKMIWLPDAGFLGTVGGGQFERLVLDDAKKHFNSRSCAVERYTLASDADQCCGGVMDAFFEYHGPRQRVVLFGAGHVSEAVARLLRDAPLEVVIADDRADWNTAERFPGARRVLEWTEGVAAATQHSEATLACVMTCSHDTDFELMRTLLEKPPAFLGLIGSRSKRACFFHRLAGAGATEAQLERIHCPIGLGDMGKEPSLVAVSIAGQILLEARKMSVL